MKDQKDPLQRNGDKLSVEERSADAVPEEGSGRGNEKRNKSQNEKLNKGQNEKPGKSQNEKPGKSQNEKPDKNPSEKPDKSQDKNPSKKRNNKLNKKGTFLIFMVVAAILIAAGLLIWFLKQREDKVNVVPLTLAGAKADSSEPETAADEETQDEQALYRPVIMVAKSMRKGLRSARRYSLKEPQDDKTEEALAAAAEISGKSLNIIDDNRKMSFTDYSTLLQIVEAECTGGDLKSKLLVANVILNRVDDKRFPGTVYEVVWQRDGGHAQFSPTQDGRMGTLTISEDTKEAVKRAIEGEDNSEGALFFMAPDYSTQSNVEWFENELVYLFSYGGHDFYTYKDKAE